VAEMRTKKLWYILGAVFILALGAAGGVIFGISMARPFPPNLDDQQIWLPIKIFRGRLSPDSEEVNAKISAVFRLSDGFDTYTIMQNKIEIKSTDRTFRFLWPDNETYVAGWCDVLDIDDDRTKEFLLYAGTGSLRVVSFIDDKFQFRPQLDSLWSFEYEVGPFDLNSDNKLEFIEDAPFPSGANANNGIRIPRVKRWLRARGFVDVSKEYSQYYLEQVIPEMEQRIKKEANPEIKRTILQAIEFIKHEIL
jgi:hypothetical protein